MHIVKDENGNVCSHSHGHTHSHVHTYEHAHDHNHEHGREEEHVHEHGHSHAHGESCPQGCSGCSDGPESGKIDKNAALLNYMLQHNQSHAAELDQVALKLNQEGKEKAAEQIRKAACEFQKGNMYLSLALSLVNAEK